MRISASTPGMTAAMDAASAHPRPPKAAAKDDQELRKSFTDFVGQTLFGQTLKAMRKTVGKPAYFYGGRAEEIFTGQLDQLLAEKIASASADKLAGPMFELFMLPRS